MAIKQINEYKTTKVTITIISKMKYINNNKNI